MGCKSSKQSSPIHVPITEPPSVPMPLPIVQVPDPMLWTPPCVVTVDGLVYDVTDFVERHPGGIRSIVNYNNKDASVVFHRLHGKRAHEKLKEFRVI